MRPIVSAFLDEKIKFYLWNKTRKNGPETIWEESKNRTPNTMRGKSSLSENFSPSSVHGKLNFPGHGKVFRNWFIIGSVFGSYVRPSSGRGTHTLKSMGFSRLYDYGLPTWHLRYSGDFRESEAENNPGGGCVVSPLGICVSWWISRLNWCCKFFDLLSFLYILMVQEILRICFYFWNDKYELF